jgi:hypothetical protein
MRRNRNATLRKKNLPHRQRLHDELDARGLLIYKDPAGSKPQAARGLRIKAIVDYITADLRIEDGMDIEVEKILDSYQRTLRQVRAGCTTAQTQRKSLAGIITNSNRPRLHRIIHNNLGIFGVEVGNTQLNWRDITCSPKRLSIFIYWEYPKSPAMMRSPSSSAAGHGCCCFIWRRTSNQSAVSAVWHCFGQDNDADSARQLLRTALHQLKVACGDIIVSDNQQLALRPDIWVDTRTLHTISPGHPDLDELINTPT